MLDGIDGSFASSAARGGERRVRGDSVRISVLPHQTITSRSSRCSALSVDVFPQLVGELALVRARLTSGRRAA